MHNLPHGKGQPWWNPSCGDPSCGEAKRRFREISRCGNPTQADRKEYRKVIKKGKIEFLSEKA